MTTNYLRSEDNSRYAGSVRVSDYPVCGSPLVNIASPDIEERFCASCYEWTQCTQDDEGDLRCDFCDGNSVWDSESEFTESSRDLTRLLKEEEDIREREMGLEDYE
jgi:hypothetical protein